MNKKAITDLAIQAGAKPMFCGMILDTYDMDEYKFAELIIEKCIEQCEPEKAIRYSPNSLSARENCRDRIKTYFGV